MKAHIFITCLIDALFPHVGESMVAVLRRIGVDLEFLDDQTCCGQPAFNSGYHTDAKILARRFLSIFDKGDYIVCPSGSCTSMVKIFYKELLKNDPEMHEITERVSARTREFSDFIVNVLNREDVGASFNGKVTYHDSCHLLRELGVKDEPRKLINSVKGIDFIDMSNSDACCGFGGTFSIKFPNVSVSILDEKIENITNTGADAVISADMGCLMQIGGALRRRKIPIKTMHLAELLASDQTQKSII
ncbi:MAG: (Fe-S)-binding protein [Thermodesulfobacteriota bacterium]